MLDFHALGESVGRCRLCILLTVISEVSASDLTIDRFFILFVNRIALTPGPDHIVVPANGRGAFIGELDFHFRAGEFHQEATRHGHFSLAAEIAVLGMADLQFLLRPGDAHEHQAAFLFEFVSILLAALMRQQSFFDGHEKDDGKFQPLRGVKRHQRHAIDLGFPAVGVADQRSFLQKRLERVPAAAVPLVELPRDREQFFDVGQPLLVFLVARVGIDRDSRFR